MKLLLFICLVLTIICDRSDAQFGVSPPRTVTSLNVDAFLGRWFQMYTSFVPASTFEKDGYCVVNDYSPLQPPSFRVTTFENVRGPTGDVIRLDGIATNPAFAANPGKFEVAYEGQGKKGYAWIAKLGNVDPATHQYQWAVVSDPIGVNLFILARDVDRFRAEHEAQVLFQVGMMGFRFPFNRPIRTYQEKDCIYPPKESTVTAQ